MVLLVMVLSFGLWRSCRGGDGCTDRLGHASHRHILHICSYTDRKTGTASRRGCGGGSHVWDCGRPICGSFVCPRQPSPHPGQFSGREHHLAEELGVYFSVCCAVINY